MATKMVDNILEEEANNMASDKRLPSTVETKFLSFLEISEFGSNFA